MRYTTRIIVPPKIRRSGMPGGKDARHAPQVLGIRKSFGFGDLLGLATPGHVRAAALHKDWAPFFAQQSPEELAHSGRTLEDAMRSVTRSLDDAGHRQPWGADAAGLKTPFEVEAASAAGYTYFTIDPSEFIRDEADELPAAELAARIETMVLDGTLPEGWDDPFVDRAIELSGDLRLVFHREPLQRAAVKYGSAIQHCARMYETVARSNRGRPFEIEVSMAQTASPATPLEHLFVGLELEARQVRVTALALRYAAEFEPGSDFAGDTAQFEERLREHVAVARFCGPYKLSFPHGADKFEVYPIMGRVCDGQLHIKTSGTSYLEGLRAILRVDLPLFTEIAQFAVSRFAEDSASLRISTSTHEVQRLLTVVPEEWEDTFLNQRAGRQLFLATYASVLSVGRSADGRPLREVIVEKLGANSELYHEMLAAHFDRHLRALGEG